MIRRSFLIQSAFAPALAAVLLATGCRGKQVAHVLNDDDQDMVGSHAAGAETWKPLIEQSVGKLLARQCSDIQSVSVGRAPKLAKGCAAPLIAACGDFSLTMLLGGRALSRFAGSLP